MEKESAFLASHKDRNKHTKEFPSCTQSSFFGRPTILHLARLAPISQQTPIGTQEEVASGKDEEVRK